MFQTENQFSGWIFTTAEIPREYRRINQITTEGHNMTFILNLINLIFTMLSGWFSILGDIGIDELSSILGLFAGE